MMFVIYPTTMLSDAITNMLEANNISMTMQGIY